MTAADPIEIAGSRPEAMSREALVDEVSATLIAEGSPPLLSRVIAETYATSVELQRILGALDDLENSGPLGKMFAKAIKGR